MDCKQGKAETVTSGTSVQQLPLWGSTLSEAAPVLPQEQGLIVVSFKEKDGH